MFGLIDCNNFYASCERVFNPALNGKPVVVLSNNDGCVIARSNESKALGIKMGTPYYQIKQEVERHGIAVFSSNYVLYGDMSSRVMSIVAECVPEIEVYSIDESFINFEGIEDIAGLGQMVVKRVCKGTGIPVSLGIAPTKTLAKVANKFAKKYEAYQRVCIIDSEEKHIKALQLTEIGDVWGIGRRHAKRLMSQGVTTAYDFTQLSQAWVRKNMTVVGERIWKELRGISCIDMESAPPPRKQICTSRSFGKMIVDYDNLSEAVATHAATCASKLRQQGAYAASLMVFILTNRFREDLPQYHKSIIVKCPTATCDSLEIVKHALMGLKQIYMDGYSYKKAGVVITEITSCAQMQLFDDVDRDKRERLMTAMDRINGKYTGALKLAAQGSGKEWQLKRDMLSQRFSTNLNEIMIVRCK